MVVITPKPFYCLYFLLSYWEFFQIISVLDLPIDALGYVWGLRVVRWQLWDFCCCLEGCFLFFLKFTEKMVRKNWGSTYSIIWEGILAGTFFVSLVETPFWDMKESLSVKWKISGPWHVVTLTFMMTLIDVLDDTLQNTLPSHLGHCSPEEKARRERGGWVEAVSLVSQETALKLLLTSVLGAQSFGPSVMSALQ